MRPGASGSALIAVLWCLVLLEVVAVGMLRAGKLDLRVVKNHGDLIQAHYLALAGVEKAKAIIYRESMDLRLSGRSHGHAFADNQAAFRDVPLGRGLFRVIRGSPPGEGPARLLHGVSDEESRLDLNHASFDELKRLPGMNEALAAAIIDWRDRDSRPSPGGAEVEDYASLSPPYRPRNGSFPTLRELLMVRGASPDLLFGEDRNSNGILDPEEQDGAMSPPPDNGDGRLDGSWSGLLTVESSVENLSARGKRRINIKEAGEDSLATLEGVSTDLAKAIVAYRGQKAFESLADLLEVTPIKTEPPAPPPQPPPGPSGSRRASGGDGLPGSSIETSFPGLEVSTAPPGGEAATAAGAPPAGQPPGGQPAGGQPAAGGEKLVSEALFRQIADDITVDDAPDLRGRVNINTAPATVLACLNGISLDLADAIVAHRGGNPFTSIADLLEVPGMTREIWKGVSARVTARSGTYRILSEGLLPGTGARKRIEVVVRMGSYQTETLSYREDA